MECLGQFIRRTILAATLALAAIAPASAQSKPKVTVLGVERPASAIFIGNSFFYYNNSLHNHFGLMLRSAEPGYAMRATSVTISGSGADWHDVDSYFRPNAIGMYSFDANNNVAFNKLDKLFDIAIMMDCSQCPIHPQLKGVFHDFSKKNAAIARKHGATPVYFMSWAYADKPEMTAELAEAYTKAGNDNDVLVVPVGLAFAESIKRKPDLVLYAPDKRHPSIAGTYLSAAVLYATLLRKSPSGIKYTAGLDGPTAEHLQSVAKDSVESYFGVTIAQR